jgi:hypothetical protein
MVKTLRSSPFNDEDLSINIQNISIDSTFSSILMDSFFDILTLLKDYKKIFYKLSTVLVYGTQCINGSGKVQCVLKIYLPRSI